MLITSVNNEKIKELVKLNDKKYRDNSQCFLVETSHLVEEAYKKGLLKTLIVERDYEYNLDIDTIYVSSEVMKKLSDTVGPVKVMGVVKKIKEKEIGNKVLLLDNISDPGNLGTIIRSAVAFNIDTIILNTKSVDLYNPKVVRASEGMLFHLNIIVRDLEELIPNLKKEGYLILGTSVTNGVKIEEVHFNDKYALVMGNESKGISNKINNMCDEYLNIEMNNLCESLNVAVATSILMYEINKR